MLATLPRRHAPRGRAPAARLAGPPGSATSRASPLPPAPPAPDLGQPGRPPELGHRPLAVPARRHAAVHPDQRLLAQHGRVDPADHRPPCPRRAAPAVPGGAASPGSTTPSPAGMPTRPRSSGMASGSSADNALDSDGGAAHWPPRPIFTQLRRDPLASRGQMAGVSHWRDRIASTPLSETTKLAQIQQGDDGSCRYSPKDLA